MYMIILLGASCFIPAYLPLYRIPCAHDDIRITLYSGLSHCHVLTGTLLLFAR